MTIKQALYDFITDDNTLADPVRNNAREILRDYIGDNVFDARRPQNTANIALTLARGAGTVHNGLSKPLDCAQPTIDVTLWTKDGVDGNSDEIFTALKQLLHQYVGPLNADFSSKSLLLTAEPFDRPVSPVDGTDGWKHRKTMSFSIAHNVTAPAGVN